MKKNLSTISMIVYVIIFVLVFGVWMICNSCNINYDQYIDLDAIVLGMLLIGGGVLLINDGLDEEDSEEEES